MSESLWGKIPGANALSTPNSILTKQGKFLEEATAGALVGVTVRKITQTGFSIDFYLEAPRLNHYRYHLFKVVHDVHLFPLKIFVDGVLFEKCDDEAQFKEAVGNILGSETTMKIVQALLAQVRDDGVDPPPPF